MIIKHMDISRCKYGCSNISNLILRDATDGSTYTPTTSKSRKGNAHDWFYAETGAIQYLIEVGSATPIA